MGAKHSKVIPLPIPLVVKRINHCVFPDDRNALLDYYEMLDINMSDTKDSETNTRQLKESDGMHIVIATLRNLIDDVDLVTVSLQLFEAIKYNVPIVMEFIQFGGLDVLEKAYKLHQKDEFVASSVPQLREILLSVGATASIEAIKGEDTHLHLCQCCQQGIELEKHKYAIRKEDVMMIIPKSSDRINRVMKFMDNYLMHKDVQIAALDVVLNFARNADAPLTTHETIVLRVVSDSIKVHSTTPEIIWRACMAFSIIATFNSDVSYDIIKTDVPELLIDVYASFKKHTLVQQQILRMMASILMWPVSKAVLNAKEKFVKFFKQVIDTFDTLKADMAKDPAARKKGYKDDKLYELVIPLAIRTFMRESKGVVIPMPQFLLNQRNSVDDKSPTKFNARRNFDEKPRYGTVDSKLFSAGVTGLVTKGNNEVEGDDEDRRVMKNNKKRVVPDWEKTLDGMHK